MIVEGHTVGRSVIVVSALDRLQLPGRKCVTVIVHYRHHGGGDMHARLGAVAAWYYEVGMPANGHRLRLFAHVLGCDRGLDPVTSERDGEVQVSVGNPMTTEVSGVDHTGHCLSICGGLCLQIFHFRLGNQSMN